jgi:hypothetical protein
VAANGVGVTNGLAYVNLHCVPTLDFVYEIFSQTNLPASSWNIETEVFPPDTNQNVTAFTVPGWGRTNLFLWARDWTGVTSGGNQTPEWWFWKYFGTVNLSDANLDSQGNTLLSDYTNGFDPNVIQFTMSATNSTVNQSTVAVQVNVLAGVPSYYAALVNDANPADANWQAYMGTNITVNLGSTDGVYSVSVGLRGLPPSAQQTWQTGQLTRDTVAPTVVITSPDVNITAQPTIQLAGYTTKPLSAVSYDVSNALGVVSNQTGSVTLQYLDPVSGDFTTNWIQCYDIDLTNGVNTITLRVTDWAGNITTTNVNITLDYSTATNPVVQVVWPQDGDVICASNFTCRGTLDDPTATVTAQITDTNGNISGADGLVERNGNFWLENLPLNGGNNALMLVVSNAAGLMTTISMDLSQGTQTLAMNPVPLAQLWQPSLNVTGVVSDAGSAVWVNGIQGVNNGDGTWYALNVPVTPGGVACFDLEAYPSLSQSYQKQELNSQAQSSQNPFLNNTNNDKPSQIVVTSYKNDWTNSFVPTSPNGSGPHPNITANTPHSEHYHLLWQEDIGTTAYDAVTGAYGTCTTNFNWPADEDILNVRNPSQNGTMTDTCSSNLVQVGPPTITPESCQVATNWVDSKGTNTYTRQAQAMLTLLTGGKGQSHRLSLFQISGSVLAVTNIMGAQTGYPLPPNQFVMGALGSLGADSNLWCALKDNNSNNITPKVSRMLNPNYYTFTASQQKYPLTITASTNGTAIDLSITKPEFCVGQEVTFALSGLPNDGSVMATNFQWTLSGNSFNALSNAVPGLLFPICSAVPYVNTNLLKSNTATAWWFSGGTNPPNTYSATANCALRFTNGNSSYKILVGRPFSMYRPQAKIITTTGTVSVNSSWGDLRLAFGVTNIPGIVFSNSTTISSGAVYWLQVINSLSATRKRPSEQFYERAFATGLDNQAPYGSDPTNNPNRTTDSPNAALTSDFLEYNILDGNFTMWLLFTPNGNSSHAVPLRAVNWNWAGSATNSASGWAIESGPVTNSVNPTDFDTQIYPYWTTTVTNNLIPFEYP